MKWGLVAVLGLNLVHTEAFEREDFVYDVVLPILTVDVDFATHGRRRDNEEHPLSSRTLQHDEHFDHNRTDFVHAHARSLLLSLPLKNDRTVTFECIQLANLYHPHYSTATHEGEQYGVERCQYKCLDINHPDATPGVLLTCDNNLHGALHIDGKEHFLEPAHYLDPDQKHVQRTSIHGTEHVLHDASEFADNHPMSLKNSHVDPSRRQRRMDKEVRVVDMEVVADYAFHQKHGENARKVVDFLMAASYVIFNTEAFQAEYRLATKRLVMVNSQNYNTLDVPPNARTTGGVRSRTYLDELRAYHGRSNIISATVVGISGHDLDMDDQGGGVAGVAGVGSLCRATAAGVSQGFGRRQELLSQKSSYGTVAHEIGHNFGGNHGCTTFGTCSRHIMNYGSFDQFKGWTDGGYWTPSNVESVNNLLARWPNIGFRSVCTQMVEEANTAPILPVYEDKWSECIDGKQYRSDQCYGPGNEEYCTIRNQGPQCRLCGSNTPCPTANDVCASQNAGTVSRGGTCANHQCGGGNGGGGGGGGRPNGGGGGNGFPGFPPGGIPGFPGFGRRRAAEEGMPCPRNENSATRHKFCLTEDGVLACRFPPPPAGGAAPPPAPPTPQPQPPTPQPQPPTPQPQPPTPQPQPPVFPPQTPVDPPQPPVYPPQPPVYPPQPPVKTDDPAVGEKAGDNNLAVIIGILVGGIIILVLIGVGVFMFMRRRESSGGKMPSTLNTTLSLDPVGETSNSYSGNSYSGIPAPAGASPLPAYSRSPAYSSPARPAPYTAKPQMAAKPGRPTAGPKRGPPSFSSMQPKPMRPAPGKPAGGKASFNKVWDPSAKAFYYVNEVTGESQWDAPN